MTSTPSEDAAPSNRCGELEQHGVALGADALEDVPDGVGDGGVDLEPWLEPLPPLAEVEELEHHSSSSARMALAGAGARAVLHAR